MKNIIITLILFVAPIFLLGQKYRILNEYIVIKNVARSKGTLFEKISKKDILDNYIFRKNDINVFSRKREKSNTLYLVRRFIQTNTIDFNFISETALEPIFPIQETNGLESDCFIIECQYKSQSKLIKDFKKLSKIDIYKIEAFVIPQSWYLFYEGNSIFILYNNGGHINDTEVAHILSIFEKRFDENHRKYFLYPELGLPKF